MNDLLTWAPLITAGTVIWAGHGVMQAIHAAGQERRADHRELMEVLEAMADDVGKLELYVGGLSHRFDPPDLSAYD